MTAKPEHRPAPAHAHCAYMQADVSLQQTMEHCISEHHCFSDDPCPLRTRFMGDAATARATVAPPAPRPLQR